MKWCNAGNGIWTAYAGDRCYRANKTLFGDWELFVMGVNSGHEDVLAILDKFESTFFETHESVRGWFHLLHTRTLSRAKEIATEINKMEESL